MVGVDGEDEPQPLEALLALGAQYDASVHASGSPTRPRRDRRRAASSSSVPSRSCRVASLACFVQSASEYGPAGRTTRSRVNSCGLRGLGVHAEIVRAAEDRLRLFAASLLLEERGPLDGRLAGVVTAAVNGQEVDRATVGRVGGSNVALERQTCGERPASCSLLTAVRSRRRLRARRAPRRRPCRLRPRARQVATGRYATCRCRVGSAWGASRRSAALT